MIATKTLKLTVLSAVEIFNKENNYLDQSVAARIRKIPKQNAWKVDIAYGHKVTTLHMEFHWIEDECKYLLEKRIGTCTQVPSLIYGADIYERVSDFINNNG